VTIFGIVLYICDMIQRQSLAVVQKLLKQFPVVVLLGPRQSGKTTIAKSIAKTLTKPSVYFDLESPADQQKFYDPQLLLSAFVNDCVIIDEVQRMPELFALLRHMVDEKRKPGRFLLLGSASPDLVKNASETLAGRVYYLHVHPFHITELPQKTTTLSKHWFRGGFPDAFLAKTDAAQFAWMDSFIRTFVERDLNQLFGVNFSTNLMMRLWRMLAHHHGGVWNAHSFSKGLDVSPTTINKYIYYLEGAFMIRTLPSFHYNSKKRLVKAPKVYIRDSGIINYLLNIHHVKQMHVHPALGNLWEGYVIEQILQVLPNQYQAYFYRTHDGAEMDLVIVKGIHPYMSIEIKNSVTPTLERGFYECLRDLNTKKNFVIIPKTDTHYQLKDNVYVCDITNFITTYCPK
jgi:uncharacterized protein